MTNGTWPSSHSCPPLRACVLAQLPLPVVTQLPLDSSLEDMVAAANLAPPGHVLDLGGQVLRLTTAEPLTLCLFNPITIRNGSLHLAGKEQRLVVVKQALRFEEVTVVGPGAGAGRRNTDRKQPEPPPKGLVQVTGGCSSLHLAGCKLCGGAHDAVLVADGGASLEMSGGCVVSGHPARFGCIVSGGGSSLVAEGCTIRGNTRSGVYVAASGRAALTGCQLEGSRRANGLTVKGSGSRVVAQRCTISGNSGHGAAVRSGGNVELTGCQLSNNKHDGLSVCGVGSRAVAQECGMAGNRAWGAVVLDHGWAQLTDCTAGANRKGSYRMPPGSCAELTGCVADERSYRLSSSQLVLALCLCACLFLSFSVLVMSGLS